jgi:hypothetical protein
VKNKDGQPEDVSPLSRRFWGSGKWRGCAAALPRVNALKLLISAGDGVEGAMLSSSSSIFQAITSTGRRRKQLPCRRILHINLSLSTHIPSSLQSFGFTVSPSSAHTSLSCFLSSLLPPSSSSSSSSSSSFLYVPTLLLTQTVDQHLCCSCSGFFVVLLTQSTNKAAKKKRSLCRKKLMLLETGDGAKQEDEEERNKRRRRRSQQQQ